MAIPIEAVALASSFNHKLLLHPVLNSFRNRNHVLPCAQSFQQHHKLVAAQSGYRILVPHAIHQLRENAFSNLSPAV